MSFGTNPNSVVGTLCFWRFLLGFGVGGDYPLSATIMSEYSSRLSRGAFIGSVFSMQGIGILTAAAVVAIVTHIFGDIVVVHSFPKTVSGCVSWTVMTKANKTHAQVPCPHWLKSNYLDDLHRSCPPEMDHIW